MSPNNGILLNGVLRAKEPNIPFASYLFINIDFLLPHKVHFDHNTSLPFLVFKTFESTSSASFLYFKQYVNMFYND